MEYTKYIDKFESAEAIQTAIDNGVLNKPYVALDLSSNTIDWNSRHITPEDELIPLTREWLVEISFPQPEVGPFVTKFYVYTGFTRADSLSVKPVDLIGSESETNYEVLITGSGVEGDPADINSVPEASKHEASVEGRSYVVIDFGELSGVSMGVSSVMNFIDWVNENDSFYDDEGFYGIYLVQ